jgi:hypothetical protein
METPDGPHGVWDPELDGITFLSQGFQMSVVPDLIVPTRRRRYRFWLWTLLALPVVAALGLYPRPFLAELVPFSGEVKVDLEFVVVHAGDGQPIEGALIRLVDPFHDGKVKESRSGRDGRARMGYGFAMRGERRSGSVSFYDCWLEVSAAGHHSSITTLAEFTGTQRDINDPRPPAITITLREGNDPVPVLGGIAGTYTRDNTPGLEDSVTILPDGRFVYRWSGSFGCSAPYPDTNLGYAQLTDGLLVLSLLKRDGQSEFKTNTEFLQVKFQTRIEILPISWGDRVYLIPRENMMDFCNAVNLGSEPRYKPKGLTYVPSAYLRVDDWKKRVVGFPKLPPEWMPYLLTKPVRGKILEVMEDRRARVDLGSKNGIRLGMELCVPGPWPGRLYKVISVEPNSCVVGPAGWWSQEELEPGRMVTSWL